MAERENDPVAGTNLNDQPRSDTTSTLPAGNLDANRGQAANDMEKTPEEAICELEERRATLLKEQQAAHMAALCQEIANLETGNTHKRAGSDSLEGPHSKDRKPADPLLYWGKNIAEHRNFIRACNNAFAIAPCRFTRDAAKVTYAMQFTWGEAREAWFNHYKEKEDKAAVTWEHFKTFLLDQISDPVNRTMEAASRYQAARQQPAQSVQAFATELATWEAQLPAYTEEQQVQHLFSKLQRELCTTITNFREIPKTQASLISLASTVERNLTMTALGTNRSYPQATQPV